MRNYLGWEGGGFKCKLRTSKSGTYLDQNWVFVHEGVGVGNLDFFRKLILQILFCY